MSFAWNAESVAALNVTLLSLWLSVAVIAPFVVAGVPSIEKSLAGITAPFLPNDLILCSLIIVEVLVNEESILEAAANENQ